MSTSVIIIVIVMVAVGWWWINRGKGKYKTKSSSMSRFFSSALAPKKTLSPEELEEETKREEEEQERLQKVLDAKTKLATVRAKNAQLRRDIIEMSPDKVVLEENGKKPRSSIRI